VWTRRVVASSTPYDCDRGRPDEESKGKPWKPEPQRGEDAGQKRGTNQGPIRSVSWDSTLLCNGEGRCFGRNK
jgi:hypothetical protein